MPANHVLSWNPSCWSLAAPRCKAICLGSSSTGTQWGENLTAGTEPASLQLASAYCKEMRKDWHSGNGMELSIILNCCVMEGSTK